MKSQVQEMIDKVVEGEDPSAVINESTEYIIRLKTRPTPDLKKKLLSKGIKPLRLDMKMTSGSYSLYVSTEEEMKEALKLLKSIDYAILAYGPN